MIRFFVAGVPKSMAVGKSVAFKRGGSMHHFQKRTNTEWATLVGKVGQDYAPAQPLQGPLVFMVKFFLPKPASLPKKQAYTAMPVKRPDLDNLFHKLTDQFNGVFYADDSQIVTILLSKRYPVDGRTGAEISVAPITNVNLMAELEQAELDMEPATTR